MLSYTICVLVQGHYFIRKLSTATYCWLIYCTDLAHTADHPRVTQQWSEVTNDSCHTSDDPTFCSISCHELISELLSTYSQFHLLVRMQFCSRLISRHSGASSFLYLQNKVTKQQSDTRTLRNSVSWLSTEKTGPEKELKFWPAFPLATCPSLRYHNSTMLLLHLQLDMKRQ